MGDNARLQQLAELLASTFSPAAEQRRSAERSLEAIQLEPDFGILVLTLSQTEGVDRNVRQAAALLYKNFIRKYWKQDDTSALTWSPETRSTLKNSVVDAMINLATQPALQVQVGEAITLMAETDFPEEWSNLIDQLVGKLTGDNFVVNNAVLATAHSIFKRWRAMFRTDKLFLEIKFVLERFCQPYLAVFQRVDQLIQEQPAGQDIKTLAKGLLLCLQLFFDLNSQDIPEFFEDNQAPFMDLLHKYLTWSTPALASTDDEEEDGSGEAGELEKIRASICEIVELYSQRYQDVFPQMDNFVQTVWTMLISLPSSQKYDILVSKAIKFLSVVVRMPGKQALFANDSVLEQFCERIILPNMALRPFEEELFEDDPVEYLRRDLEGVDSETRRQAAADFTQALMQQYEQQITTIITRYVTMFLDQYGQNTQANWKAKDTAIFLLTSVASRSSSTQHGVTSTNALVDIVRFFSEHVAGDLGADKAVHPIIKADAIKFVHTFRSQLSKEQLLAVLPMLIPHLSSPSYVIHTYAAIAIERCLNIKKENVTLINSAEIKPYTEGILVALLKMIESGGTPEKISANDHLMKCVMRVVITAKQGMAGAHTVVLQHLVNILTEVSKNPSNPKFNHYAFESISALIRFVVAGSPSTLSEFETALFPPFTYILSADVAEFSPFVFQILSQLLELHQNTMPDSYQNLIGPLLNGNLWTQTGNVPALVRLLRAIMAKGSAVLVANNQLGAVRDIVRFLNTSGGRKYDSVSNDLVEGIFEFIPVQPLLTISRDIFIILLTKLQKKSETWAQGFIRFLFYTIAINRPEFGADEMIGQLDAIQSGIFGQVLGAILPDIQRAPARNRKIIAVGLARLLTQSQRMFQAPLTQQWPPTLSALLGLFLLPQDLYSRTHDDNEDVEVVDPDDLSYQTSFSRLGASEAIKRDPLASVTDVRAFFAKELVAASRSHPGQIPQMMAAVPDDLRNPFMAHLSANQITLS